MALDSNGQGDIAPAPVIIAGVGASAGGITALLNFFSALPEQVGAALVVVVHLAPDHESDLAQIIATRTRMRVQQVGTSADLEPNCVYVIPPNRQLVITDTHVSAVEFDEPRGQRAPIAEIFRSWAPHGGGLAIIFSGS